MDLFEEALDAFCDVVGFLVDIFVGEQEMRMNPGIVLKMGVKVVMFGGGLVKLVNSISKSNKKSRW